MKHCIYNFSAGPAVMPKSVLAQIQSELLDYEGSGMSVMEMSHRSSTFLKIYEEAVADLRTLMHIPDNYKVLFIQGGATLQFSMAAMNLTKNGCADYIVSGAWSEKAFKEGKKFTDASCIASSKDRNYAYVPDCSDLPIRENADYVYICENETIHGTTYPALPNTKGKILVCDQSSMFLSKPCNVADYGLLFAGVQKNVAPAGMSIVIIREDLISSDLDPKIPTYLRYDTHANADSMYNTPNCWAIYVCGKVFKHLLSIGGLEEMEKINRKKAQYLYDFLDQSELFHGIADKSCRSMMNVPFITGSDETDKELLKAAEAAGLLNLKGHRSVGGLRASIYNAMPMEGVEALVKCLQDFEKANS